MMPHRDQIGASREWHLSKLGGVANLHATKSLGVQGAVARALDGSFERRIDVEVSVRQRFLCYKANSSR
jgi:hypothetical protein